MSSIDLTRARAIEEHRRMWRWLSQNPGKDAVYYFTVIKGYTPEQYPYFHSFLCDYARKLRMKLGLSVDDCYFCPIKWNPNSCCTIFYRDDDPRTGIVEQYENHMLNKNYSKATECARIIANMPERNEGWRVEIIKLHISLSEFLDFAISKDISDAEWKILVQDVSRLDNKIERNFFNYKDKKYPPIFR